MAIYTAMAKRFVKLEENTSIAHLNTNKGIVQHKMTNI